MNLEPVAWMTHESQGRLKGGGNCKGAVPVHQQRSHAASIPLYAIPEGFAVVPVEPTEAMICASVNSTYGPATTKCSLCTEEREEALFAYKAMLAAAKGE